MPSGAVKLAETFKRLRGKRARVDVASISGVSAKTIDDIENGRNPNPTIQTILALCETYQISPIDLLIDSFPDLTKPAPEVVKESGTIPTKDVVELIDGFSRSSDVRRALILFLVSRPTGDITKVFRSHRVRMSYEAAKKLQELLASIERIIITDQSET